VRLVDYFSRRFAVTWLFHHLSKEKSNPLHSLRSKYALPMIALGDNDPRRRARRRDGQGRREVWGVRIFFSGIELVLIFCLEQKVLIAAIADDLALLVTGSQPIVSVLPMVRIHFF
jgi:hypothetical protein